MTVDAEKSKRTDKENIEAWLEDKLNVDDAHVKDIKVFEREVEE